MEHEAALIKGLGMALADWIRESFPTQFGGYMSPPVEAQIWPVSINGKPHETSFRALDPFQQD